MSHPDLHFPQPRPLRLLDASTLDTDHGPPVVVLPGWVRDVHPTATEWRPAGDRQWLATVPGDVPDTSATLLVRTGRSGVWSFVVDLAPVHDADGMVTALFEKLAADAEYAELPTCVAPGCTQTAPNEFTAAVIGHFAGVMYSPGDPIRLCDKHAYEVRAAAVSRLEDIAGWLRPDAEDLDRPLTMIPPAPMPRLLHPEGTR